MALNIPRLPIEVYEHIIDHCSSSVETEDSYDILISYRTLQACSLTCAEWLPRCRRVLYSAVMFRRSDQVDILCTTLHHNPSLGEHVRALRIDHKDRPSGGERYIPFARYELVSKLRNVRTLALRVDWRIYPPRYHDLVSLHYPITELFVWTSRRRNRIQAFQLLRTFRWLARLHVYSRRSPSDNFGGNPSTLEPSNIVTGLRTFWFSSLQYLEVDTDVCLWPSCLPPPHVSGSSLVELVVHKQYDVLPSRFDMAKFFSQCPKLKKLTLIEDIFSPELSRRYFSEWATNLISCTQSHQTLRQIFFRFWPPPPELIHSPIMPMSRHTFLYTLLDFRWATACEDLESAQTTMVFTLPRASMKSGWDTSEWWEGAIRACLSPSQMRVLVEPSTDGVGTRWPCPWIDIDMDDPRYVADESDLAKYYRRGAQTGDTTAEAVAPVVPNA